MSESDVVRFYWSFRSPYAWFAAHRVERMLHGLPVELEWIPVFPPPDHSLVPNLPTNLPSKARYMWEDSQRFADTYGLEFRIPEEMDTDWPRPHAAALHAGDQGKGPEFVLEGYRARFSRGEDVADDAVLSRIARTVGLDPAAVVAAADDPALRERIGAGFKQSFADEVFGVPTFVYRGLMFFGNDRLEWLVDAIDR